MDRPADESAAALARYRARLRRPRLVYAVVVAVVVVALGVITVVAWAGGETNNTTSRTVAEPPDNLALGTPAADQRPVWRTNARAAIGQPQWQGTVVVSDRHAMSGVDARTGKQTWTYRRSDRTVCTAAQASGIAIVVFRLRGNCDQVAALDAATGERRWSRTLDMDGMPVSGTPDFQMVDVSGTDTFVVRTGSVIYAIAADSGLNRWTYTRYGCRIDGAVVGGSYGLISQTCGSKLRCGQLSDDFCFTGPQLFLLPNGFNRDEDSFKEKNPDHITWNRRLRATPVSAGTLVSAVNAQGTALLHLDEKSGQTTAQTALSNSRSSAITTTAQTAQLQYVSVAGSTYLLRPTVGGAQWRATGAATVVPAGDTLDPATARVTLVSTNGTVTTVNGTTGRVTGTFRLTAGSLVYPLGQGFLVAGAQSTMAYA